MKDKFEFLNAEALEKYNDKVKYAFTTRHGGVSKFPYESLNISFRNLDERENAHENLNIVCENLGFNYDKIVALYQDHTDKVLVITEENKEEFLFKKHHGYVYDAAVTNVKNVPLLITVADCNAVVMYDTKNNVLANIHSGWKGTTKRIYLKTLDKMIEIFGTNPQDVICQFSPSIQSCCWKTKDDELVNSFKRYWEHLDEYVKKDSEGWNHVDFPYVISKDLIEHGIKKENIYNEGICTCCNVDRFFSYRKKTELGQPGYGLQVCIVELI